MLNYFSKSSGERLSSLFYGSTDGGSLSSGTQRASKVKYFYGGTYQFAPQTGQNLQLILMSSLHGYFGEPIHFFVGKSEVEKSTEEALEASLMTSSGAFLFRSYFFLFLSSCFFYCSFFNLAASIGYSLSHLAQSFFGSTFSALVIKLLNLI